MSRANELHQDHVAGICEQIEAGTIDREAAVAAVGGDRGEAETLFGELSPAKAPAPRFFTRRWSMEPFWDVIDRQTGREVESRFAFSDDAEAAAKALNERVAA